MNCRRMPKRGSFRFLGIVSLFLVTSSANAIDDSEVAALGDLPELFAPEIFGRVERVHSAPALAPDGGEMFFSVYIDDDSPQQIMHVLRDGDGWGEPRLAAFSGAYQEGGPVFSPTGDRLYFYSKRPLFDGEGARDKHDIWYVARSDEGWSEPRHTGPTVNSPAGTDIPCSFLNAKRALVSLNPGPEASGLHLVEVAAGEFGAPTSLGPEINRPGEITGSGFITADGNALIHFRYFQAEPERSGLHVSLLSPGGKWQAPQLIEGSFSGAKVRFPCLSHDGKHLFFTRYGGGKEELYWVSASVLENAIALQKNSSKRP